MGCHFFFISPIDIQKISPSGIRMVDAAEVASLLQAAARPEFPMIAGQQVSTMVSNMTISLKTCHWIHRAIEFHWIITYLNISNEVKESCKYFSIFLLKGPFWPWQAMATFPKYIQRRRQSRWRPAVQRSLLQALMNGMGKVPVGSVGSVGLKLWWEVMGSDGKWWEDWKTFQNHQTCPTCPKVEKLAVVFPTFGRNNYRWASKFEGPARWRIGGVGTWLPNN